METYRSVAFPLLIFGTYVFFQGGKSIRIVNCILALKSYSEWKLKGGTGPFRYGSNMKNNFGLRKPFLRKSSEPFMSSMSRTDQPLCSDVGQVSEKVKCFVAMTCGGC